MTTSPTADLLLLVNPHARSGRAMFEQARNRFAHAGLEVDARLCDSREAMNDAIRTSRAARIVIGGGDGTISGAGAALLEAGRPLGILPLGTANDLARTLRLPVTLEGAIAAIITARPRAIDLGLVNGRPFFNAVTIGLGVDVKRVHESGPKKQLGVLNYPRAVLITMLQRRYFKTTLTVDGTRHEPRRMLHIGVANGRYHGGGLPAHEDATIDDELLHLYAIRAATPLRYLKLLPALLRGTGGNPDLLREVGATIAIETDPPQTAAADGEPIGETPLEITCLPRAREILSP